MRLLTEKKQKEMMKMLLDSAAHTQYILNALYTCRGLSPKEYGNEMSKLAHNTTEMANEIYGTKGVIMCNEKFGIGGR